MKISAKKYADALYKLTVGKSENEIRQILKEFARILIANRDLRKLNLILNLFSSIWNKHEKAVDAEIKSGERLDEAVLKDARGFIADIAKAKNVNLKEKIDKNILGGVVISYNDKVIDGSLRTRLRELHEHMIK